MMEVVDIIKLKKTCTIFLFSFNLMYEKFNELDQKDWEEEKKKKKKGDYSLLPLRCS
jgi:hypothetical protein